MINISKKRIEEEMKFWQIPAMAISVVRDGESFSEGYGISNVKDNIPCNDCTDFLIASCSKAMTSAVIAMLVQKGLLEYDRPVTEYLHDFKMKDEYTEKNLTIKDILCHSSGLGGHDAIWPNDKTLAEFIKDFRYLEPNAELRQKAEYSNIMYSVLGALAEQVTGKKWPDILREYLLDPLKMFFSYSSYEDTIKDRYIARPYQYVDGKLTELKYWNLDSVSPAASVVSNARDMAKWLTFLINEGKTSEGERLLSEELFRGMHAKLVDYEDALGNDQSLYPTEGYAMGWQPGMYRGHRIVKHMGKIEGFSSMQMFLPDDNVGVALMMNLHSPSVSVLHTLAYEIIDELLGLEKKDWVSAFRKDTEINADTYRDCDWDLYGELYSGAVKESRNISEGVTGSYFNKGYGRISIREEQGKLFMKYRNEEYELKAYVSNPYKIEGFKEDIITFTLPLEFIEDCNEKITGLRVRFEPLVSDIVFHKEK